ncbi:hypothetical protein [Bacillus sp. Cr_A10]|uniref:hypothetical protein n=1 Tax=Bacillus sp. Cr_A10 TaxID=3033993 RepID=UPI0023DBEDE0|nr:hypothetical protein [Bacillus sp. Cr_A10]MDF2065836.1 hypothetical protein [Bacillus sp. Cr_A10]
MERHLALLKRLRVDSGMKEFIRNEIRKKEAGIRGEERLLRKLKELRLPGPFRIFSDVGLHIDDLEGANRLYCCDGQLLYRDRV